jgi:hypothetical protein
LKSSACSKRKPFVFLPFLGSLKVTTVIIILHVVIESAKPHHATFWHIFLHTVTFQPCSIHCIIVVPYSKWQTLLWRQSTALHNNNKKTSTVVSQYFIQKINLSNKHNMLIFQHKQYPQLFHQYSGEFSIKNANISHKCSTNSSWILHEYLQLLQEYSTYTCKTSSQILLEYSSILDSIPQPMGTGSQLHHDTALPDQSVLSDLIFSSERVYVSVCTFPTLSQVCKYLQQHWNNQKPSHKLIGIFLY